MDEDIRTKMAVLEERIFNVKESHAAHKVNMDDRFNAMDAKVDKVSIKLEALVSIFSDGVSELKVAISENKNELINEKEKIMTIWKTVAVICGGITAASGLVVFALKHFLG